MFNRTELEESKRQKARLQSRDEELQHLSHEFVVASDRYNYAYQWTWLGLPVIQLPADIVAIQEIIWANKPDIIIETGIAWGGSVALYASLLQLAGKGEVVAVDINLMDHVADQIMSLPFSERIHLYKGSSTDPAVFKRITSHIRPGASVMLLLDSNHTHEHVLDELRLYAPLVTKEQHLVVSDTIIEFLPPHSERKRDWGKGNNPLSAVQAYLLESDRFQIDEYFGQKILTSFNPGGYLRCIR